MRLMRRMWITVEVTDARFRKAVCDEIRLVVEKMSGDFVKSSSLDSLFVLAMLPHRKYKTLEKAVACRSHYAARGANDCECHTTHSFFGSEQEFEEKTN